MTDSPGDKGAHRYIGPYLQQGMLGYGNMGVVYRGWDERLDRPVALKRLRPSPDSHDDRRQRFRREARAVAQLSHSHIVRLFDLLETDQGDWLVMEFVEGRSLESWLAEGAMEPLPLLRIVHQIAKGLEEAHHYGIVHRDLKPENVVIDDRGHVKILDFGLAKILGPSPEESEEEDQYLTSDGIVVGTPHAMSPEQIRGHGVDARSDLFALGALLYRGLCGVHPFFDKSPALILRNICRLEPKLLHHRDSKVPRELSRLVHELLQKEPDRRPENARQVARRLARIARALSRRESPPV